jgi:diacylglycerol kinase family enzyme
MRIVGVFNRDGGSLKTMDADAFAARAVDVFGAQGHELDVRVVRGAEVSAALDKAGEAGEALLAAGGDGTVSSAARVAYKRGIPLGVLPAGTMNLFARSLGIPPALDAALTALAAGAIETVDIATANGKPFVHQFSVGIHPKLVRLRDRLAYRSRVGKMLASGRASMGVLFNPPNFVAEVSTSRGVESWRLAGISISNNPLDEGHLPLADRLDRGVLGIYLLKPLTAGTAMSLAFGLVRGKFRSLPEVIDREAREATIRFPRKKAGALAVMDGELMKLPDRIDLKIQPGALKVLVPRPMGPATSEPVTGVPTAEPLA